MPQSKPPKNYLTAGEVKKMLGITDGMLYNFIDNGALERIIPPGRKQGVYRRNQVEQLARDLQVFINTRNESHITFEKATTDDLPILIEIGTSTYPGNRQGIASLETRLKWFSKNPDMYYLVRDQGEIVGYTAIIPMTPDKIQRILEEKEFLKDVQPEEIEEFKPGKPLHIYISTMRTKKGISKLQKRSYGVRLIGGLITTFIQMIDDGITIHALYARSETVDGIRALKNMGFTQISATRDYKNYALGMENGGAKVLQRYKQAFERRYMPEEDFRSLLATKKP